MAGNLLSADCDGALGSEGGNLDGGTSCQFQGPGDFGNAAPGLDVLADNGGLTLTHAFTAASPALDGGVDPCPATDQRGMPRPQNRGCDIGAYEFDGVASCRGVITVGAAADGWVLQSSPAGNFGNDSVVKVESKAGGNARVLIRFTLPEIPSGCGLVDARLRLYASSHKDGRALRALRLGGAWTEDGVTWNRQPATAGPAPPPRPALATGSGPSPPRSRACTPAPTTGS